MQIKWREIYQRQRTKRKDKGKDKGGNTAAVALGETERWTERGGGYEVKI